MKAEHQWNPIGTLVEAQWILGVVSVECQRNISRTSVEPHGHSQWNVIGNLSGTSREPQWNFSGTCVEPQWNLKITSMEPQWNLSETSVEPQWNLSVTSVEP